SQAITQYQNLHLQQQPPQMMQQMSSMYYQQPDEDPLVVPIRRETSHRKAKGRSIANLMQKSGNDDELEEPAEFVDSDSDPAWTPQADKDEDEDIPGRKKSRKTKHTLISSRNKRGKSNILTGAGISEFDSSDDSQPGRVQNQQQMPVYQPQQMLYGQGNRQSHHGAGDFVVSRAELIHDWPCIWRVDGKNLLQKYEPFTQNGKTLYKNIQTYAAFTSESKRQYAKIPIRVYNHLSNTGMFVEFLRTEMTIDDTEMFIEKVMQESSAYQDNFEVYIQTLISQALDSNFLTEITQEQDEYFLSNVKTIDDITNDRKRRLLNITPWPKTMTLSVETWPCYNIVSDLGQVGTNHLFCVACHQPGISMRLILYGNPYNPSTIETIEPDIRMGFEKDLPLCRVCSSRVELYHKITHQKYLMYIECAKKVTEKNAEDPNKGTTTILNELLADDVWLAQLFKNVRFAWAEVDHIERQNRFVMSARQQ
ncbi:Glutamine and serine-rich protein 1, partial [Pseudolycoriella hygida]